MAATSDFRNLGDAFTKHLHDNGYPDLELVGENPFEKLSGGYCRECYKVATNKGDFVLSIFTFNWQKQSIDYIHGFMHHIASKGVEIAEPVGPFGKLDNGTAFEITPFMKGKNKTYFEHHEIEALGHALGKIHEASLSFDSNAKEGKNPNALMGWISLGYNHGLKVLVGSEYAGFSYLGRDALSLMKNSVALLTAQLHRYKLPKGTIHGDMNRFNILWDEGKPIFLDFERSRPSDFAYEIAKAMIEYIVIPGLEKGQTNFDEKIKIFLNAYHHERPLTAEEIEAMPIIMRMHSVLAGVKQSAMGMGRRYPPLPQGTMLQFEVNNLSKSMDFKNMLDTPLAPADRYIVDTPSVSRS